MKKPVLIMSLDFELFWGMQDVTELNDYEDHILGGRKAVSRLLSLFEKYGIHVTWATVGMMFAENKNEILKYMPEKELLPTYDNSVVSVYRCLDNIGDDESVEPCFYGSSLIREISQHPGMEIGSHTFSHYYCREKGQTVEQFAADLSSAGKIAAAHGYKLTSLVLPRNQVDDAYIKVLKDAGITAYRDEENDWIHKKISVRPLKRLLRLTDVYVPITGQGGYIPQKTHGVWNFPGSRMYKPFFSKLSFLEDIKIHRIKKQMLHAAQNGLVFHLWFHPHNIGVHTDFHLSQLDEIFRYYQEMNEKYGMVSLNMNEAVMYFEQ